MLVAIFPGFVSVEKAIGHSVWLTIAISLFFYAIFMQRS